jgi:hypothetical protein
LDAFFSYVNNAVVGFLNTSLSGVEQGLPLSVPVAYQKGGQVAEKNLVFNVESTPGTASEFTIRHLIVEAS